MISRSTLSLICAAVLLGCGWTVQAAPSPADLPAAEQRRAIVETALRLARPPVVIPLSSELVSPFNPAAFSQPTADEAATAPASNGVVRPLSNRELLQHIATSIKPSGTAILGGEPQLIFGQKRFRVGDSLPVTYDGRDYHVELTAVERTTYTLRLNRDEITRPIKPGKTP